MNGTNGCALEDWSVYRRLLTEQQKRRMLGLTTGFPRVDQATGGLRGITFLGGLPATGKTALALSMAIAALRHDSQTAVLFYSLDMSKIRIYHRLLCHESQINHDRLLAAEHTADEGAALSCADERLRTDILPRLRVIDKLPNVGTGQPVSVLILDAIQALFKATSAVQILTVIDYFQLLPVPPSVAGQSNDDHVRVEMLRDVLQWTRHQTTPDGCPMLVISEVRKGEPGRSELAVADLMGSSRLASISTEPHSANISRLLCGKIAQNLE